MSETPDVYGIEKETESELTSTCREQVDRLHEVAIRHPVTDCVSVAAAVYSRILTRSGKEDQT